MAWPRVAASASESGCWAGSAVAMASSGAVNRKKRLMGKVGGAMTGISIFRTDTVNIPQVRLRDCQIDFGLDFLQAMRQLRIQDQARSLRAGKPSRQQFWAGCGKRCGAARNSKNTFRRG